MADPKVLAALQKLAAEFPSEKDRAIIEGDPNGLGARLSQRAGDYALDKTGSPLVAAGVKTAGDLAPMMMPGVVGSIHEMAANHPVLSKITTPEMAASLKGAERTKYLNALDEVYGPRDQRAKDMGFGKKTYYHGTQNDFDAFDPGRFGSNTEGPLSKDAAFFSSDPKLASDYAGETNQSVMPVRVNQKNGVAIHPEMSTFGYDDAATAKDLFDNGKSSVLVKGVHDPYLDTDIGPSDLLAVKDPSKIRSVNAAFDPRFVDSSNLLAGKAGVPMPTQQQDQNYANGGLVSAAPNSGVPVYDISSPEPIKGSIAHEEVQDAISSGKYSFPKGQTVPVIDPSGNPGTIDASEAPQAFQSGYQYQTPDIQKHIKYSSTGEQIKTGLEGLAEAFLGPLAPMIEKTTGAKDEDIRGRAEENPWIKGIPQALGLGLGSLTGTGEGALLDAAGSAAAKATGLGAEGAGIASHIGAGAVRAATEMGIMSAGDETSKLILNDPDQSLHSAMANVGLSTLIGAGSGAALGTVSPLWKATVGDKLSQFIEDYKGRLNEHLNNPDPLGAVTDELANQYKNIVDVADDVYGAKGLKAQEITKLMPEMHEGITAQLNTIKSDLGTAITTLENDPYVSKLQKAVKKFESTINEASPEKIFEGTQELKQQLQEWGKFNKTLVPLQEREFRDVAKELGFKLRTALEDPSVWGKAADRQQAINKAFREYLPALQDFEKKFTEKVGEDRVVSPAKVSTYMNQLGKPTAEIKQTMLENFLKASEKYRGVINETHTNLGIESPFQHSSLNQVNKTLDKLSPGQKAADILVKKGLANVAGKGLGSGVGAIAGAAVGHPWLGGIIGEHALGPFFSTILPSIVKPLMGKAADGEALKASSEYGMAIIRGNRSIENGVKALFKPSAELGTIKAISTKDREKLDKKLKELGADGEKLIDVGGKAAYYMPHHAGAFGQTAGNAVSYLNSIRPSAEKQAPLDSKPEVSKPEQAAYDRALDIAEQPSLVLKSIKDSTLTPQDVTHLKNLYPSLYDKIAFQITEQISNRDPDSEPIPYKQRLSLSLFLNQPLDSTMSAPSIQATQAQTMPTEQMPQQPQGVKPTATGLGKLGKMSAMYQTPQQARQASKGTAT